MAGYMVQRPRIPVRGPGVPADRDYGMLPTTDWMPYTWSLNNVVMGENIHAALVRYFPLNRYTVVTLMPETVDSK